MDEYPEDWRSYFASRYSDTIIKQIYMHDTGTVSRKYSQCPNEMYYRTVVEDAGKWFKYDPNAIRLSSAPGFNELMCIKKGECYSGSHLGVYILRSLGIPSTIDFVPLWGSRNGAHATEVFLDTTGKMRTPSGRELNRPPKVFRISFKKQNLWKDSIAPSIRNIPFVLKHLHNNHWLDVTNEHTITTDITAKLPDSVNVSFAYICVYNYGKWEPVYWGWVNKMKQVIFRNMGCSMLYRTAIPSEEGFKLIGKVFLVDSVGKISYKTPVNKMPVNMTLNKLNTGALSWVKKGESYSLYLIDKESQWQLQDTKVCTKDSTINFTKVPNRAFYRLVKQGGNQRLERIFTYENGKQAWW